MADVDRGHGDDAADETQHAVGFAVGRRRGPDDLEQRFGVTFQHRDFIEEAGIEFGIGQFLERMDVILFAGADTRPAEDRIFGCHAAELVVTDHSAQQAIVTGGHARVLVD